MHPKGKVGIKVKFCRKISFCNLNWVSESRNTYLYVSKRSLKQCYVKVIFTYAMIL